MYIRRVEGKSMLPSLVPGDIVFVSRRKKIRKGDIVVASLRGREVIKRVSRVTETKCFLVGDNKKHSTDSRKHGWVNRDKISGVAIWAVNPERLAYRLRFFKNHRVIACFLVIVISVSALAILQKNPAVSAALPKFTKQAPVTAALPPAIPPKPTYPVGQTVADVPYCNEQKLDIYYPRVPKYAKVPVVMYIHGGGWELNNKSSEMNQIAMVDGLRDEGFAVVSIDYRKLPEFIYPAPIEDSLCAVRFLKANSAKLSINKNKIAIYGFSAGGHLAAMVGVLDSNSAFNNGQYKTESSRVQAVVTLASLFDLSQNLRDQNISKLNRFMVGQPDWMIAAPISYVTKDDSPFLLVHGMQDQHIDPVQDTIFSAKLSSEQVPNQIIHVQNAEHGLGEVPDGPMSLTRNEVSAKMREYIKKQLLKQ